MNRRNRRRDFRDVRIFRRAMDGAMEIYHVFHRFPEHEEQQGLAVDVIRASRTVCAKIGAAWGARHDYYACTSNLEAAKNQVAETLVFIDIARGLGYIDDEQQTHLFTFYDNLLHRIERLIHRRESRFEKFDDLFGRYNPPEEF
jgi:four helix bundle protein